MKKKIKIKRKNSSVEGFAELLLLVLGAGSVDLGKGLPPNSRLGPEKLCTW